MTIEAPPLSDSFTSTGVKYFHHQEAMAKLRSQQGMPIVTHIMPTDVCQYKCAFCSVQYREGDALELKIILEYVDDLLELGLKAVILSGGGNPLLYKCPADGWKIEDLITALHYRDLEIGMITNGVKLKNFGGGRHSYPMLPPETLDFLTWIRISLAGWDHDEDCWTPDIDPEKTTLGGSYVFHDIYNEPLDKKHGRVSTPDDILSSIPEEPIYGMDRLPELTVQMRDWAKRYNPAYVRLLPNCLEPDLIPERTQVLQDTADNLNSDLGRETFFVQSKPPRQPHRCLKGYPHPVLNCDGYVYPCDSVVLNRTAGHKFGSAWRICPADQIRAFYKAPIGPNVPNDICPGCVFSDQVDLLDAVADGMDTPFPAGDEPQHVNFV